jgi:uncharacterized protein (DUF302 family)
MEELDYTRRTQAPHANVLAAVEAATAHHGFRVLHVHQVHDTLAEKGFSIDPYSIVEVCNAGFAHRVLGIHKPVGMMLPCRIVVYVENGETVVTLMKPTLIASMMPGHDFAGIPAEVERVLMNVVDAAVA